MPRNMNHLQLLVQNLFSYKEEIQFHMFCAGMKHRIMSKRNCTHVITVNKRTGEGDTQLSEERLYPKEFRCSKGQTAILSFSAGSGDDWLFLGPPRDEITAEKNTGTRGRTSIIRVKTPICITKGLQLDGKLRDRVQDKPKRYGAFEITHYSFDSLPMRLKRVRHELTYFVNRETYVRSSDCSVWKGTNN